MALLNRPEDEFDMSQFTKRAAQLNVDIERFRMDVAVATTSARTPKEMATATAGQFACNTLLEPLQTSNFTSKQIVEILNLVVGLGVTLYNFGVSDGISEATEKYNKDIPNDAPPSLPT
jgi:hypothetical protein